MPHKNRKLAPNTVKRFQRMLTEERDRLKELIEERHHKLEEARMSESSADRSPDQASAEAGSMVFEYEKELSVERNALDMLTKVEHALDRINDDLYGDCEQCSTPIPVARLNVIPYTTVCVECSAKA